MNAYGAYRNIRNSAWQVLIDYNITSLPVDVIGIATDAGISVIRNSDVNELRTNEIGVSILADGKWYIIYDDTQIKERIRFTVAHELGHIFLGHPLKDGYHARTVDTDRPESERNADMFAARLLTPACVVWGLGLHSPEEICREFGISYSAAKVRADRMQTLYRRNSFLITDLERQVFENFREYISKHRR